MLFQNKCLLLLTVIGMCINTGCKRKGHTSPAGYDLNNPQSYELGKALNEVSGIFFSAEDSSLLTISDSKEKIIQVDLKSKRLEDITGKVIPPDSDMEDIVQVDSVVYLLMSRGTLLEVPLNAKDTSEIKRYDMNLSGTNDFETLYHDRTAEGLVLLCKTCAHEKGSGVRTAFRFDLRRKTFDPNAFFTISRGQVKNLLKNADAKFEPSAAAIHPVSKRLYILSSAGQIMVVSDTRGQVIEAYTLNPDLYPQAEGIAFAPNGDMYISNEGKYGKPTLLYFPYQQSGKKK